MVADNDLVADFFGFHSLTQNMLDNWRSPGDSFVRSWEDRFATEEGLERIMGEICQRVPGQVWNRGSGMWARLPSMPPTPVVTFLSVGSWASLPTRYRNPCSVAWAIPGPLFPLCCWSTPWKSLVPASCYWPLPTVTAVTLWLSAPLTLPMAMRIQVVAVYPSIWSPSGRSTVMRPTPAGGMFGPPRMRARRPAPNPPSVAALWREADKNLRFYGARCNSCQYVQYPPQQVCVNCRERVASTPIRLSDQPATVFTYSMDYIAGTTDTPLVVAVVDFQCVVACCV